MTDRSGNFVKSFALVLLCSGCLVRGAAFAQAGQESTPAAAETKMKGCVQRSTSTSDPDALIFSNPMTCAKLTGKFAAPALAGREIELQGILTGPKAGAPASIEVRSIRNIGKVCSDTCSLRPPGTRGLGKGNQTPGKEGGTPGLTPATPPPATPPPG